MNKKDKIVQMLSNGGTVKEIVKAVKCTPDYVYQVQRKSNKDKQVVKRAVREDVKPVVQQVTTVTPNDVQVGGSHYKEQDIQVWDAIHAWKLGYFSGNVVKYVARHTKKDGVDDLLKARHYLDKLIELHLEVK